MATLSRGTAAGRDAALLARLAQHLVIVDGPLNGVAGPHVIFEGVNVHIRSGAGTTDEGAVASPDAPLTGLGNLVLGYNSPPDDLADGERRGSHGLIIGDEHRYSGWGHLVAGFHNAVSSSAATVTGGAFHIASGQFSSVLGGNSNRATGDFAVVSGGGSNRASGPQAAVSGGRTNHASGVNSAISGGSGNSVSGTQSTIGGGTNKQALPDNCWRAQDLNDGC